MKYKAWPEKDLKLLWVLVITFLTIPSVFWDLPMARVKSYLYLDFWSRYGWKQNKNRRTKSKNKDKSLPRHIEPEFGIPNNFNQCSL